MDILAHAIATVRFSVPIEVLQEAFIPKVYGIARTMQSMDENMMALVIRPRVMVNANIVGGTEEWVPLSGIPVTRTNDYTSVYRVPKAKTAGREILAVKNITFSDPTKVSSYGVAAGDQNTTLMQAGQTMMDALGSMPVTSTARVSLIASNTIMVRDTIVLPANIYVRCLLANDDTLSHIPIRAYNAFAEMTLLAVKSFVYNSTRVRLDKGALAGGQDLGVITQIIDEYKDAEQMYLDFLKTKWAKIAMMSDVEQQTRFLRWQLGSMR